MISKEEFKAYIDSLIPVETQKKITQEKNRANYIGLSFIILGLALVFVFMLLLFINLRNRNSNAFLYAIGVFFSFILFAIGAIYKSFKSKTLHTIERTHMDEIIAKLLEGQKFDYNKNSYIDARIFKESGFIYADYANAINKYNGEDCLALFIPFSANGKNSSEVVLVVSDVCAQEEYIETDENGNETTKIRTYYDGAFGYITFPFAFGSNIFINAYSRGKAEKVSLEDIEFNKRFKIYSNDQLGARVVLTPDVMQKLKLLEYRFKSLKVAMVGNRMYFGAPHRNLFNIKTGTKTFSSENFMQIYDDVFAILALVNEIKNNDKIFKKEGK